MNKNNFLAFSIFCLSLVILLNIISQLNIIPIAYAAPPDDVKGSANVAIKFLISNDTIYRVMANGQVYQYTGGGNFTLCAANAKFIAENSLPDLVCNNTFGYYYTIGSDGYLYQSNLSGGGSWYRYSNSQVP